MKLSIMLTKFIKVCFKSIFYLVGLLPPKKRLIIFESYSGKQYSCNPRAIYEYMEEHNYNYKMIWVVKRGNTAIFKELGVPYIVRFSIRWLLLMPRAEFWITNSRLSSWIPKPNHTIYIQTWHGTPLKKLAADMDEVHFHGTTTEAYIDDFLMEASKWDILLSPNRYSTDIFRQAFNYNKKVIEVGYPRNDYLFKYNNVSDIEELKRKFNIPLEKKVILYAPTWRDDQFYNGYQFDLQLDLKLLQNSLSGEYAMLLRMHSFISNKIDTCQYKDFVFDMSQHTDINEIYMITDIVVTDYSSVIFDVANLEKPIIFFTYDLAHYRDKLRGFYFDLIDEAPGPIIKSSIELIEAIQGLEETYFVYKEKYRAFQQKYCYLENGSSTKQVVDEVFN